MKIAVSASGATLNSDIDPRFGRCQYFIIVDSDTMAFEAIENSASMSSGGAGISAGQQIADKGAEVVLTGNCGPNAYQTLSAAGIKVVTGVSGKVKTAIDEYKGGKFEQASQANVVDHHGKGFGRGMGMGPGRGMGTGGGMMQMTEPSYQTTSKEQELEALKRESQLMAQHINEIQRRIDEIEKTK